MAYLEAHQAWIDPSWTREQTIDALDRVVLNEHVFGGPEHGVPPGIIKTVDVLSLEGIVQAVTLHTRDLGGPPTGPRGQLHAAPNDDQSSHWLMTVADEWQDATYLGVPWVRISAPGAMGAMLQHEFGHDERAARQAWARATDLGHRAWLLRSASYVPDRGM